MDFIASRNIEKATVDSSISHFLLMLGYKIFSAFLPLFLIQQGLTTPKIGYFYLLIYLPLAIFSPLVGALVHRYSPIFLSSLGILGYAIYSLGMIWLSPDWYYILQITLGASAALFFVSSRVIIMRSKLKNPDSAFGIFYSMPLFADILAPILGAIIILQFGFIGVFIASLGIYFINIIFSLHGFFEHSISPLPKIDIKQIFAKYSHIFSHLKNSKILPLILLSFSILFVEGFFHAFFILFLGEKVGLSRQQVLTYLPILSIMIFPIYLFGGKLLGRSSNKNLMVGSFSYALACISLGLFGFGLSVMAIFALVVVKSAGAFITNSGRSAIMSRNFSDDAEEAGALDTFISPFAVAMGSLAGGLLIGSMGYYNLFIAGGFLVLTSAFIAVFFLRRI